MAANGNSTASQAPPRRNLPIVPAIPRRLEKKVPNASNIAATSVSASSTAPELPSKRPFRQANTPPPPAGTDPIDTLNTTDSSSPVVLDPLSPPFVPQPSTNSAKASDQASPHVLNPETAAFVPEPSQTSTQTPDVDSPTSQEMQKAYTYGTSSPSTHSAEELGSPDHRNADVIFPQSGGTYSLHIPAPWKVSQTTLPEDTALSTVPHSATPPLDFHTSESVPTNPRRKLPNDAPTHGNDHTSHVSFNPHPSPLYPSASPFYSTYEGYAITLEPQAYPPGADPRSNGNVRYSRQAIHNPATYHPYQYSSPQVHSLPQFGSHLPLTPSATPSNSGSQKQSASPVVRGEVNTPTMQQQTINGIQTTNSVRSISPGYREWCERTKKMLSEDVGSPSFPDPIVAHVQDNFNNPAFADCELYISHTDHRFDPTVFSVHTLLLAQNERLCGMLPNAEVREDGKRQILLSVQDAYTNPKALRAALKLCYGDHSSAFRDSLYPAGLNSESEISTEWMDNALALAATGHLLGMVGLAHRGEQIASMVLDWNNLQYALSYVMDSTIRRAWGTAPTTANFPNNASELLLSCLYFVVRNISEETRLDLGAESLTSLERLPLAPEPRPRSPRSQLSRIRFGDLPTETEDPVSENDVLMSSVLLSLPFPYVKFIVDRITEKANQKIIKPLIEERERRRLWVMKARTSIGQVTVDSVPMSVHQERVVAVDQDNGRMSVEQV
ncbi:MAG: hypothetical protein Q9174_004166 [Haloplaca sp. 1 TL-2023]